MDIDRLVELATKAICERLNSGGVKVVTFGDIPDGLICGADIKAGTGCADIGDCDYIVISRARFYELHGGKLEAGGVKPEAGGPKPSECRCREGRVIDLRGKRLIHERDLRDINAERGDIIKVSKNAIVTALAYDYATGAGAKIRKE